MLAPLSWLKEYVEIDVTPEELQKKLFSCGFEVEELYVIPSRRSMGVGKALFAFAEETVQGEADYITLSTATKNWRSILHFYVDEVGMELWSSRLFRKLPQQR